MTKYDVNKLVGSLTIQVASLKVENEALTRLLIRENVIDESALEELRSAYIQKDLYNHVEEILGMTIEELERSNKDEEK